MFQRTITVQSSSTIMAVGQQQGIYLGNTLMPLLCFQLRKKVDFLAIFYCARRSGI